jgi:hypothetical protein
MSGAATTTATVAMAEAPLWSAPEPVSEPKPDVEAYALGHTLSTLVSLGASTSPRSEQRAIGLSEVGHVCPRRLAYRSTDLPRFNVTDPMRAMVGSGVHHELAGMFTRLSGTSGRFLVEQWVSYRGHPGTVDLYDRATATVVDWKVTTLKRLKHIAFGNGPLPQYVAQVNGYAAGLAEDGEAPKRVAIVYWAQDGDLSDHYVWRAQVDRSIVDDALDRLAAYQGVPVANVPKAPNVLCPWCPYYLPASPHPSQGCTGQDAKE